MALAYELLSQRGVRPHGAAFGALMAALLSIPWALSMGSNYPVSVLGVTVVAAMGNFDDDLAHPTRDVISPDTGPGVPRRVTNACAVVPVEVSGVIGVSADGNLRIRSFYSNYGVGSLRVPEGAYVGFAWSTGSRNPPGVVPAAHAPTMINERDFDR